MAESIGNFFGSFFENLWKTCQDLGNYIGNFFKDLGSSIGKSVESMWINIKDFFGDLPTHISNIWTSFLELLQYLNPFSDKFFLKLAFVMTEEQEAVLENNKNEIQEKLDTKFPIVTNFKNDLQNAIDKQNNFRTSLQKGIETNSNPLNIEIPEYNYSNGTITVKTENTDLMNILIAYEPYRETVRNGLVLIVYGLALVYIIKFLLNYGVTDTVGFISHNGKGGDDN